VFGKKSSIWTQERDGKVRENTVKHGKDELKTALSLPGSQFALIFVRGDLTNESEAVIIITKLSKSKLNACAESVSFLKANGLLED